MPGKDELFFKTEEKLLEDSQLKNDLLPEDINQFLDEYLKQSESKNNNFFSIVLIIAIEI